MNHGDAREKAKKICFFVVDEFGGKQTDIARALKVSAPTVSLWMKEMRLRKEVHDLSVENKALRADAQALMKRKKIGTKPKFLE